MLIKISLPIGVDESIIHPCLSHLVKDYPNATKAWLISNFVVIQTIEDKYYVINVINNIRHIYSDDPFIVEELGLSNLVMYRSINVFQQNDPQSAQIVRQFVADNLQEGTNEICGIGGEFYVYFLLHLREYKYFWGFSNQLKIIHVAEKNLSLYLNKNRYHLRFLDYERDPFQLDPNRTHNNQLLINLSRLSLKIYQFINGCSFEYILIITCDLEKFNKRRHLIERQYKLKAFEHFRAPSGTIINMYSYQRKSLLPGVRL